MAVIGGGAGPNIKDIVQGRYVASGILFAKNTESNMAIAKNPNSLATEMTDIFAPVTLATGKITSASVSSPVVQGTSTSFLTDFADGDYLFYYDLSGSPLLVGRIASVDSDTQITLTGNSSIAVSTTPSPGQLYPTYCGKSNTVIGLNESVIMAVPVVPYGANVWMPNWNAYRQTATPSSYNKTAASRITTISAINNPTAPASPINISYTIASLTEFVFVTAGAYKYAFANGNFPSYVYALLNPYGDSLNMDLYQNTLYQAIANQDFENNGILVSASYPEIFLKESGY
jgi:hypothetical protein